MHVRVANKDAFQKQVAAMFAGVRAGIGRAVYQMAYDAQTFAMSKSPIFSGDFASNWNVSVGSVDPSFSAGSGEGPSSAPWGRGNFNFSGYRIGQPVFLANDAEHEEPYAWKIEQGMINFREENISADRTSRVLGKTQRYLAAKYRVITKEMMAGGSRFAAF